MFGLLKKKISSFIDNLTKKEEEKPENEKPAEPKEPIDTNAKQSAAPDNSKEFLPEAKLTQAVTPKAHSTHTPEAEPIPTSAPEMQTFFQSKPTAPADKPVEPQTLPKPKIETAPTHIQKSASPKPMPAGKTVETNRTESKAEPAPQVSVAQAPAKNQETPKPFAKPPAVATQTPITKPTPLPDTPKERKLTAKIGILSQITGIFTREVQIHPSELEPMLDELNMALLESDVTLDTAEHIVSTIKTQLAGRKVDKSRVQAEIQAAVKAALVDVLDKPELDLITFIRSRTETGQKPVKILLLGPNGAGKTTTLAKIAYYLKQNNIRCVLAAADTFRAAAIEQLQHHGTAIGVPVIKHQYGADPAAVAFDAIAHAKAHGLDVVLIDTAGRQETNLNLLKEMEKINRVVAPDLKLFIGEAVAGHALVEQAKTFHAALKLDGVILTKVDCDAKGGTSFSVAHEVGVPIVLLGTGQDYGDIRPFDAKWLISNVLAE
ncbi:signal recognition particle-docking protein FtsY [Candidatus Micrarchaeota archaeon]|nr:signal recognition particle-docking protein FtsY [Candidatus Micrarchaeota archaeon]